MEAEAETGVTLRSPGPSGAPGSWETAEGSPQSLVWPCLPLDFRVWGLQHQENEVLLFQARGCGFCWAASSGTGPRQGSLSLWHPRCVGAQSCTS